VAPRPGHARRDVGNAVVDHALLQIRGVSVGRGPAGLDTATLVDGKVDDHGPRPHGLHHGPGHQHRRPPPGHVHGTDQHVGGRHSPLDIVGRGQQGDRPAPHQVVQSLETPDVCVEHRDLGAQPEEGPRRVAAQHAGAEDHHVGRRNARNAAEQHPPSPQRLVQRPAGHGLQQRAGDDRRQSSGHLAGRQQHREHPVVGLYQLVGDGGHPLLAQGRQQVRRCHRQMQEGQQGLTLEIAVLFCGGPRHFDDHLGATPDLFRRVHDPGAGVAVLVVGEPRPGPGAGLHVDRVPGLRQAVGACGNEADAILLLAHFRGDTEFHGGPPVPRACGTGDGSGNPSVA